MAIVKKIEKSIKLLEGVTANFDKRIMTITGPKGSVSKKVTTKIIIVEIKDKEIIVSPLGKQTKKNKCMVNTFVSHFNNMISGVVEEFVYKLKICASHFPMDVKIKGNKLVVTNFIGEKVPRNLMLKEGANVKMAGKDITVTSCDKEIAGQVAADIEKLTKRTGFDRRIFQDGIYITVKAGVVLE